MNGLNVPVMGCATYTNLYINNNTQNLNPPGVSTKDITLDA